MTDYCWLVKKLTLDKKVAFYELEERILMKKKLNLMN